MVAVSSRALPTRWSRPRRLAGFTLQGHTIPLVGPNGPRARKDTVLVPPKATVQVDFDTDNPERWITHRHNTYHLEAGMAKFLEYSG